MTITIEYCGQRNYIGEASSLEVAIKNATTIEDINLHEGSGGVFDVTVDKTKIYSKDKTGRFPTPAEILDEIILYDIGRPTCGLI
jgi:selT/selW/selH-like putative selenoprotein